MSTTTLTISNLGPVILTQSSRAKCLRITVCSDKTITMIMPRNGSLREAKQFLQTKLLWLQKQLRRYEQLEQLNSDTPDIASVDLEEAQRGLFSRLGYFSEKYKLPYNRTVFRCQKTRWGSCSSKNNINLNVNITFLPTELQDYVLLHELVHTKVKNHSKDFWAELDKYTEGRAKKLSKELKRYNMKLRV